ncbi:MAG: dTDP-4-dehydrorhamnose reductase [Chitinophagaceae bacterium]
MTVKTNILVTGANGQLGHEFRDIAVAFPAFTFIFLTREELAIDNPESVAAAFRLHQPQYCINCAAYTAVDKAETDPDAAYAVNAAGPANLAAACKASDTLLIHISTDYVFAGTATTPYKEDEATEPLNVYGASKLEGERRIVAANPDALIIRTSWVYSRHGKNFVKTMLRLMSERDEIGVVSDQFGSPTYAADLAAAIMQLIGSEQWEAGTYHYCNTGAISWYDFALAIRDMIGSSCRVNAITTADYPTPAWRPVYSVLDTTRIEAVFGIRPPHWRDSLQQCLLQQQPLRG